ncbi:hypothetical protein ES703_54447 [subsurface metagenome]
MIGSKGLAQGAAIIGIHTFIGHPCHSDIPFSIDIARLLDQLLDLSLLGIDGDLDLVHNSAEIVVIVGMKYVAQVLKREALFHRALAEANPGDIPLANMLNPLGAICEVVDLSFQNGLKVLLHLAPRHLDHDRQRDFRPRFEAIDIRPHHGELTILYLIGVLHAQPLEADAALTTELGSKVSTADYLSLEGGAIGNRNGDRGNLYLNAPDLDTALY